MSAFNELVATVMYPQGPTPPATTTNTVTKEELEKAIERLEEAFVKLQKNVLTKNGYDLHNHIRLNRPLKWKYKWNGEKKYAILGEERLEFWHSGWDQWRPFTRLEAADTHPRIPA